nr:hypothetical protein [Candidatus Sigynarchaeota archaeon]
MPPWIDGALFAINFLIPDNHKSESIMTNNRLGFPPLVLAAMFVNMMITSMTYGNFIYYQYPHLLDYPESLQGIPGITYFYPVIMILAALWNDSRPLGLHRRKNLAMIGQAMNAFGIILLFLDQGTMIIARGLSIFVAFGIITTGGIFISVAYYSFFIDEADTPEKRNAGIVMIYLGIVFGEVLSILIVYLFPPHRMPSSIFLGAILGGTGTVFTFFLPEREITKVMIKESISRERVTIPRDQKKKMVVATLMTILLVLLLETNINLEGVQFHDLSAYFLLILSIIPFPLLSVIMLIKPVVMKRIFRGLYFPIILCSAIVSIITSIIPIFTSYNYIIIIIMFLIDNLIWLCWLRMLLAYIRGARKAATFQFFLSLQVVGTSYNNIFFFLFFLSNPAESLMQPIFEITVLLIAIIIILLIYLVYFKFIRHRLEPYSNTNPCE